jgi:hypothetical protein
MPIKFTDVQIHGAGPSSAAEWTYIPNEDLDFSRFRYITCLFICASRPIYHVDDDDDNDPLPYVLPSFPNIFTNLSYLRIGGRWGSSRSFIGGITDIPVTVFDIIIRDTYITDLSPVLRYGTNLLSISLINNPLPMSFHIPLPNGLRRIFMESNFFADPVIFPTSIMSITCVQCRVLRMEGLEKAESNLFIVIDDSSITPYTDEIIHFNIMYGSNTQRKVDLITTVNAHQIYSDFASIPKRIQVSRDNIDNPIVKAMNLSSNYPRRMAEFIAVTEITTEFMAIDDYPDFEGEDGEYDDEDPYI